MVPGLFHMPYIIRNIHAIWHLLCCNGWNSIVLHRWKCKYLWKAMINFPVGCCCCTAAQFWKWSMSSSIKLTVTICDSQINLYREWNQMLRLQLAIQLSFWEHHHQYSFRRTWILECLLELRTTTFLNQAQRNRFFSLIFFSCWVSTEWMPVKGIFTGSGIFDA